MIIVHEKAEVVVFGKPIPEGTLRITPATNSIPGKTCTVDEFPITGITTYYLSSASAAGIFLRRFPTLEVEPTVIIAPSIVPEVPKLRDVLAKHHPETLL
jgi:hypothetical protein